jgi:hypothetical protein
VRGLASQSEALFAQEGPSRLVLVTCAGWDGAQYHGNTVVIARPLVTADRVGRAHAHAHHHARPSSATSRSTGSVTSTPTGPLTDQPTTPTTAPSSTSTLTPPPGLPYWYPCVTCRLTADQPRIAR